MKINESNNMLNKKIFEELSLSQLIKLLLEKNVKPERTNSSTTKKRQTDVARI